MMKKTCINYILVSFFYPKISFNLLSFFSLCLKSLVVGKSSGVRVLVTDGRMDATNRIISLLR